MGREIKGFTRASMERLVRHDWSGNVRELENEIERCVALAGERDTISVDMLSDHLQGEEGGAAGAGPETPLGDLNPGTRRPEAPDDPQRGTRDRKQEPGRPAPRHPAAIAPEDDEAAGDRRGGVGRLIAARGSVSPLPCGAWLEALPPLEPLQAVETTVSMSE